MVNTFTLSLNKLDRFELRRQIPLCRPANFPYAHKGFDRSCLLLAHVLAVIAVMILCESTFGEVTVFTRGHRALTNHSSGNGDTDVLGIICRF